MGFSPQQVREMSIWQFTAAWDGFVQANSPEDKGLSDAEVDDLWEWIEST